MNKLYVRRIGMVLLASSYMVVMYELAYLVKVNNLVSKRVVKPREWDSDVTGSHSAIQKLQDVNRRQSSLESYRNGDYGNVNVSHLRIQQRTTEIHSPSPPSPYAKNRYEKYRAVNRLFAKKLYVNSRVKKVVNPHLYGYVINQHDACFQNREVSVLVYVHTAPQNTDKREVIRQTWGNRTTLDQLGIVLLFFVGVTDNRTMMTAIKAESDIHHDVIQVNFTDSYRNLTIKATVALAWIHNHCTNAQFILKLDDDMYVNAMYLTDYITYNLKSRYFNTDKIMMCWMFTDMPVGRETGSKWFVTKKEFGLQYYAPYCSGWAILISPPAAEALYHAIPITDFYWIDDVYLTMMLRQKAGAVLANILQHFVVLYRGNKLCHRRAGMPMFLSANITDMRKIYKRLRNGCGPQYII